MRTSEQLDFVTMCKVLPTYNKRTNRRQKLEEAINIELEELGRRIYEYQDKGEITIKMIISPDKKRDTLKVTASISTKPPTEKVEAELYQGNNGAFYADHEGQGKLDVVADINQKRNIK